MGNSSSTEVDNEFLISLNETRPVQWDKIMGIYKDKNEINKAWRYICVIIKIGFEGMNDAQKHKYGYYFNYYYKSLGKSKVKVEINPPPTRIHDSTV